MEAGNRRNLIIAVVALLILTLFLEASFHFYNEGQQVYSNIVKFASQNEYRDRMLIANLLKQSKEIEQERKLRAVSKGKLKLLKSKFISAIQKSQELEKKLSDLKLELKEQAPRLKSRVKSLTQERKNLLANLDKLEKDFSQSNSKVKYLSRVKKDNASLRSKLRQINSQLKQLSYQKKKLNSKIAGFSRLQKKAADLKKEKIKMVQELNLARKQRKSLVKEVKSLKETVGRLEDKLSQTGKQLAQIQDKLKENQIKLGARAETILTLNEKLNALVKVKEELARELQNREKELSGSNKKRSALEAEISQFQGELQKQKSEFSKVVAENKNLKAELEAVRIKQKDLRSMLEDFSNMNVNLQQKISHLDNFLKNVPSAAIKNRNQVVNLGKMQAKGLEPEIALSSLIYQFEKAREDSAPDKRNIYSKKEALAHYNLALYYLNKDNFKDALSEFLKAHKLLPGDSDTVYNIALIYRYYIYDYSKAKYYFKKYLELNPDAPDKDRVKKILQEIPK